MPIVDAQVHIWGADTPERPWPPGNAHRAHRSLPFSKDDLLTEMAAAGVDRVIIVPPSWEGDCNDLALDAAQAHPDRFAVMGRPPLDVLKPGGRDPHALDRWREQTGMLGIRVTTAGAGARQLFNDPEGDWLWQAAERAGLPAMVSVPGLVPAIGRLAERHPGMRFVIDHLALVRDAKDEAAFGDLADLLAVARHPNVAAKGFGAAALFERALSLSPPASVLEAGVRRVRSEPFFFLGHRHDRHPLHLPSGGDVVHR
jgi:predicted TIM-barrel fold metal-dependent hydrolase